MDSSYNQTTSSSYCCCCCLLCNLIWWNSFSPIHSFIHSNNNIDNMIDIYFWWCTDKHTHTHAHDFSVIICKSIFSSFFLNLSFLYSRMNNVNESNWFDDLIESMDQFYNDFIIIIIIIHIINIKKSIRFYIILLEFYQFITNNNNGNNVHNINIIKSTNFRSFKTITTKINNNIDESSKQSIVDKFIDNTANNIEINLSRSSI